MLLTLKFIIGNMSLNKHCIPKSTLASYGKSTAGSRIGIPQTTLKFLRMYVNTTSPKKCNENFVAVVPQQTSNERSKWFYSMFDAVEKIQNVTKLE